ncbi:MAG: ATP synthase F1 subunit gamma [Anaerolineae bacterium]|nr:ATP synthase F1 subunit gamma [Anaerolineae bacterium]MDW8099939.1 ATP synthase F1 subunit gamma [Anaerolineae bacterium]
MASLREIRRRIRSIRNIAQVTRAMQMVAASKMRRAQAQVLATRPYAEKAWQMLRHLAAQRGIQGALHPLLNTRESVNAIGLVLITADKGLCGAYNANMLRLAARFILEADRPVKVIAIGRRGATYMARYRQNLIAEFSDLPPRPSILDITPIAHIVINAFLNGEVDEVYLGYTRFINTLTQRPLIRRLLPLRVNNANQLSVNTALVQPEETAPAIGEYIYEPDPQTILDAVLPRFTEVQIYEAVLEALASEHSARMVAMRAATDNANKLLTELTLSYNQARQDAITREMLDIAGGVEAMRQAR